MARRYFVLDVFTDRALEGNPLAVVMDAAGLDTAAMQRIAREFNLSETVFVLPAEKPGNTARIRIFTPSIEMPFAGHPTVGTAALLAKLQSGEGGHKVNLEENIGVVSCEVRIAGDALYAEFAVPKLADRQGAGADRVKAAAALGLSPDDIGFDRHVPSQFSAGVRFHYVPVRSLAAIGRAQPNIAGWVAAFGGEAHANAYLYTRETTEPQRQFHARMFWPGAGVGEDPATGSAAAGLAGVIAAFETSVDGAKRHVIEQGFEMGRPSLIHLETNIQSGQLRGARVGGGAVIVADGQLKV